MAELLLELLSEEIPARMQRDGAQALEQGLREVLAPLNPGLAECFAGPRRIAVVMSVAEAVPSTTRSERGPRIAAPEAALNGFLRKHNAARDTVTQDGDHWVLNVHSPSRPAAALIAQTVPTMLQRFSWPKSMRWGGTSTFTWVRPLRRILCLLDGTVVPFALRLGDDDGHALASGGLTEGHRCITPGAVAVSSAAQWRDTLQARQVIASHADRRTLIAQGLANIAATHGMTVAADEALLDEVTGLVEWPVVLAGQIDPAYMDLPAEVLQVSMRTHQRYFTLHHANGRPAPRFAFVANLQPPDGGAAIIAGNERVLRARFADARHFWDMDRRLSLAARVPQLASIAFHAKLGTQAERVARLERLAAHIAPLVGADPALAHRAAHLAKADLTTGMVGEFPELQGVIGAYYAAADNEAPDVAAAIRAQYLPRGPSDPVPDRPVSIALALADKLDVLTGFFGIGALPTGSGDPFALRRAALGVLRILRERGLRLALRPLIAFAGAAHATPPDAGTLLNFMAERLRVQLRAEGARHDVLSAIFAVSAEDDLVRLLGRSAALASLLGTPIGTDLLAAYRRGANILRIEQPEPAQPLGPVDPAHLIQPAERDLYAALSQARPRIDRALSDEQDGAAMAMLAYLRPSVDAFFETVRVNDPQPLVRVNRLCLLGALRDTMNRVADFSKIEG